MRELLVWHVFVITAIACAIALCIRFFHPADARWWWWIHIERRLQRDYLWQQVAERLPRRLCHYVFIRVYFEAVGEYVGSQSKESAEVLSAWGKKSVPHTFDIDCHCPTCFAYLCKIDSQAWRAARKAEWDMRKH